MTEAGKSLIFLPVEQQIKDAIHAIAKHLNRKYGMPVREVRYSWHVKMTITVVHCRLSFLSEDAPHQQI
jgi:hypothetical protein